MNGFADGFGCVELPESEIPGLTIHSTDLEKTNENRDTISWALNGTSVSTDKTEPCREGSRPSILLETRVYEGLGRLAESEGSVTTFYAYPGTETLYEQVRGGTTQYIYAAWLEIARVSNKTVGHYHTDHLCSTRLVTVSVVSVDAVFSDSYQPFGQDSGASGSETYKFTGKPEHSSVGLYYYGARWYDPEVGRFITPDLIMGDVGQPQTLNRYTYVANSPTNYVDPTGLYAESLFDAWMLVLDVNEFLNNPNLENGLILAADFGALLLPGVPAVAGIVVRGGKLAGRVLGHADDASRAVSRLDDAGDALRITTKVDNPARVVDPGTIRFSHDSVAPFFRGGRGTIDELAESLRAGRVRPGDMPPIRIVSYHGSLWTMDHRRLIAFQKAGIDIPVVDVPMSKAFLKAYKPVDEGWSIFIRNAGKWAKWTNPLMLGRI